jgi:hypothetical protein
VKRTRCVFSDFWRTGMRMGVAAWMVRCTLSCDQPLGEAIRAAPPTLRASLSMYRATVDKGPFHASSLHEPFK